MIKLIAFLGNYGKEYERTRHNTAWQFAASLPFYSRLNWTQKFQGEYAQTDYSVFCEWVRQFWPALCRQDGSMVLPKNPPDKIFFLKPLTYMNLSGDSIIKLAQFYKIKAEEIMVVHDELELVPGIFSLKWSGGLAGHNGLRSTKAVLGTADFWRLRFGIGRPSGTDIAGYVLNNFSGDEAILMAQTYTAAGELLARVLMASEPSRLLPAWAKIKVDA